MIVNFYDYYDDFEDKKKDKDETIVEKELQTIIQMIQTLEEKNKQIT